MQHKFTKIVATVGPSSHNFEVIKALMGAGADVFRLNFSHGDYTVHSTSVELVRSASTELDKPVAIFQDLQGPKIRVGNLASEYLELKTGGEFIITTENIVGAGNRVSIDYDNLHNEAKPGNHIMLDDGLLELEVQEVKGKDIVTRVVNGGKLKPHKGVNLPHIPLQHISSVTDKDRADLKFAFDKNLDFVALSFVRTAKDVIELKDIMLKKYNRIIPVIAKIEKPEAVDDIDNIVDASDAIMVARGDLGVETSPEDVPIYQKTLIRRGTLGGLPVITATQMLESMIQNPRPTRAEAADVANAVLDGTSAVMLSGETAAGAYPVEAVRMMDKIIRKTESSVQFERLVFGKRMNLEDIAEKKKTSPSEAVGLAAVELADTIGAAYIACFTHSGGTARLISKYRPNKPVIGFSPETSTVTRLALSWGVVPMEIGVVSSVDELLEGAAWAMKYKGLTSEGDYIVITAGVPVGKPGKTNMIKVVQVED